MDCAYSDAEIRQKLHAEAVEFKVDTPPPGICPTWWDYMIVQIAVLPKNKMFEGKTIGEIAKIRARVSSTPFSTSSSKSISTPSSCTARSMPTKRQWRKF